MIIVKKTCKYCEKIFQIECSGVGKGSTSKLARMYCSTECQVKNKQKRSSVRNFIVGRFMKNCLLCNKEYFVPQSKLGRKFCSRACSKIETSKTLTKNPIVQMTCNYCNVIFESKNQKRKYCSAKCTQKSKENKIKCVCQVCGLVKSTKQSYKMRFCSKKCTFEAQSKGMIAIHINGRSGWRLDIENSPYFKSSFEADFYRYCIYKSNVPLYESKTFHVTSEGRDVCYTPDFFFPNENRYIELKGVRESDSLFSKLLNSNMKIRNLLIAQGIIIDVIYMEDFYASLRNEGLYKVIPNLENRNYKNTKHLIFKHKESLVNKHS